MKDYSSEYVYSQSGDMYYADVHEFTDKMKDFDWKVFEFILSSGVSEEKEAIFYCRHMMIDRHIHCVSPDKVRRSIRFLVNLNLFTSEKVNTGYRTFNILKPTMMGRHIYMKRFMKNPATPEHELIAVQHANYHHGYMIKDLKTILERTGNYYDVCTDRKKNTVAFSDGKKCIPDAAAMRIDGENRYEYYEVECGTHHQPDMDDKCYKLSRITKELRFVGQNRDTVNGILKKQLEHWIERVGREKLLWAGVKVYLTTLTDLAKGNWTYIYDMTADEPICSFKNGKEVDEYEGYFD